MRGKPNHAILPEISLQTVWDQSTKAPSKKPHQRHQILTANLQYFDAKAKEGILNELLEIEADSLRQNNRLYFIREKTMDLVDRKISAKYLHRQINSDANAGKDNEQTRLPKISLERALADCEIQIAILRAYIGRKYGDESKNDWFDQYVYLSNFYHAKLMNKSAADKTQPFYFDGIPMEPTEENFHSCRQACLNAHVSQEFNIQPAGTNWLYRVVHNIKRKSVWRKLIS